MKSKLLALSLVALAPFAVLADGASYSYIDLNAQLGGSVDAGFANVDSDGLGAKGSLGLGDNLFIELDLQSLQTDPDIGDLDGSALFIGLHGDTFYGKVGFESADFAGVDDSGYTAEVGMRMMATESFELNLHFGLSDLGDVGSTTNYGAGAVLMFNQNMGVSLNYDMRAIADFGGIGGFDLDLATYGVGFRFSFD
jgi:hypothetical protein